jgi:hypothetical protein
MSTISQNAPGTDFSRYALGLILAKGKRLDAAEIARQKWPDSAKAYLTLEKNAVEGGGLAAGSWGSTLGYYGLFLELVQVLMGVSVLRKLVSLFRQVPFRLSIARETANATAAWIPEMGFKGLSPLAYDSIDPLEAYKACVLTVISQELAKFSTPSIEAQIRKSLAASIAQFVDAQFLNPAIAPIAGTCPGAITNGATAVVSTGAGSAAIQTDVNDMISALTAWGEPRFITDPPTACHIAGSSTTLFPDVKYNGGFLAGVPLITSTNVPAGLIVLLDCNEVLYAESEISLDVAQDASLLMDDGGSPARAEIVSMWQSNMVALKAEQYLCWKLAHGGACVSMQTSY